MPIALLYYSANVIAVLCAPDQLIMRTRGARVFTELSPDGLSMPYPDGIDFSIKLINVPPPAAANHTLLF